MFRKILIALGVLVALFIATLFYLNNRNRTLSPSGETTLSNVSVSYARPSVRDRLIFGEKEEGALLSYGYYWRLGANEPTILTLTQDFEVEGVSLPAGKYTLYAYPRKGDMELRVNSEVKMWGTMEPDPANDLVTYVARMEKSPKMELFTIQLEETKKGTNLVFLWDVYRWVLPLLKK